MHIFIGIDDTDNLESRGTGYRARMLCQRLMADHLAQGRGITRHQLLVSPQIPYTSHNSSACLDIEAEPGHLNDLWELCRDFLLADSAPGSDAGLCLAAFEQADADVRAYGCRAKQEVLTKDAAASLAVAKAIRLEGLTGTGGGIIGALAGVGLRAGGEDGRYLWMPNLREWNEPMRAAELCQRSGIGTVMTLDEKVVAPHEWVQPGNWPRPVLRGGQAVLLVKEDHNGWCCVEKEIIKGLTE